jgi:hypothetical protein
MGLVPASLAALLFLGPLSVSGASPLRCGELEVEGHKFDFSALKGPHTVTTSEFHPPTYSNTTYTLDLCAYLKRKDDVKKGDACPSSTRGESFPPGADPSLRTDVTLSHMAFCTDLNVPFLRRTVCAIKHLVDPRKDPKDGDSVEAVIPIAGDLADHGGKAFDFNATRLKSSDSAAESKREGVRIVLKGGVYEGREQKAVVDMVCDKERTGTEGEWDSEDKYDPEGEKEKEKERRDEEKMEEGDKKEGEGDKDGGGGNKGGKADDEVGWTERQLKKENAALVWEGYTRQESSDTLQLTWYTKYACETSAPEVKPDDPSSHWGFFTWMVIL